LLIIVIIGLGLSLCSNSLGNYWIWYSAAIFIGLWDALSQTLVNTILSSEFTETVEPFAVCKFVRSVTILACLLI